MKLSSDIYFARILVKTARERIFFPEGHPRRWEVTLSLSHAIKTYRINRP